LVRVIIDRYTALHEFLDRFPCKAPIESDLEPWQFTNACEIIDCPNADLSNSSTSQAVST
jgi:hypothetical protein